MPDFASLSLGAKIGEPHGPSGWGNQYRLVGFHDKIGRPQSLKLSMKGVLLGRSLFSKWQGLNQFLILYNLIGTVS